MSRYPNGYHTARDRYTYPRFLLYSVGQYSQWLWNRLLLIMDRMEGKTIKRDRINRIEYQFTEHMIGIVQMNALTVSNTRQMTRVK